MGAAAGAGAGAGTGEGTATAAIAIFFLSLLVFFLSLLSENFLSHFLALSLSLFFSSIFRAGKFWFLDRKSR